MLGQYVQGAGAIDDLMDGFQAASGAITFDMHVRPAVAVSIVPRPEVQVTFATPATEPER